MMMRAEEEEEFGEVTVCQGSWKSAEQTRAEGHADGSSQWEASKDGIVQQSSKQTQVRVALLRSAPAPALDLDLLLLLLLLLALLPFLQQDFKSNFLTPKWMGNEDVHDEME
eukprot:747867-Hanusia_phi.AAC.2